MKDNNTGFKSFPTVALSIVVVILAVMLWKKSQPLPEKEIAVVETASAADEKPPVPDTNAPPASATPSTNASAAVPAPGTPTPPTGNPPPGVVLPTGAVPPGAPGQPPGQPGSDTETPAPDAEIQLSFQGANIDMIVQWLAKTSGKSVVKHPRVQCQLTIVNSKKMPVRDAMRLVYNALALEGFTTIESSNSILIVPDGQEPKLSPTFVDSDGGEMPVGRQRVVKVFQLQHTPAAELKDRIKLVLNEKAVVEVDERGNQLIVTDYTDNLQLLASLLPELDRASASETMVKIYTLKFLQAQELANLLNLVLSNQPAPTGGSSRSRSSSPSPSRSSFPPGMIISSPSQPPGSPGGSSSPSVTPAGEVRFWPDNTSNRLIVSAPRDRIAEVEDLIASLDTEKPADVAVRVIPLLHASATDLVREIAPLYQKMSGDALKDMIEVTANERSNTLIVLSSESNFRMLKTFISGIDSEDAQEKVLQTFTLKNADAEEVAEQLRELQQSQSGASRYVYYYTPYNQGRAKETKVVADRRRNTVIVQATPADMPGIAKMIEALDEPVGDEALAPRIYPLTYVSAVDIEDVLNELFLKKDQQRNYWDYVYSYEFGQSGNGDADVGRLFGKVRITSEPYSNAIIISANSTESLEAVEAILKQLDVPSQAGESTLRVQLKFADSVTLANSLNILFAKGGSPLLRGGNQPPQQPNQQFQQQQAGANQSGFQLEREQEEDAYFPWLGGQPDSANSADGRSVRPASDLVGRVRVVPDKRSNSLLLTAHVHYFPQVMKLVNELDAPTAQVLIEAKILEVSSDFRDRYGVRWSPDGSRTFDAEDLDGSLQPSGRASFQQIFAGMGLPDDLRSGVFDANVSLDVLVQFLKKNTDATVLGEPQITVKDNEVGKLFVGAQVPFISNSLNTDVGGRNDSFQYKDVGVILEVTPQINSEEDVALKIRAESSNIRSGETLFGGAILDTRNFRTDLIVKDGQTIVLGGIIQNQSGEIVRKVPILGDIPVLGWAFKKKDKVTKNVELMVFLRPKISRSPQEAAELLNEVERRTPRLQRTRIELDADRAEEATVRDD